MVDVAKKTGRPDRNRARRISRVRISDGGEDNSLERTGDSAPEARSNRDFGTGKSLRCIDPRPLSSQPLGCQNMVSQTLSIRRAIQEDASFIADLGARTFEASFGMQNRPEDMEQYLASSFSTEQIESESPIQPLRFSLPMKKAKRSGTPCFGMARVPLL